MIIVIVAYWDRLYIAQSAVVSLLHDRKFPFLAFFASLYRIPSFALLGKFMYIYIYVCQLAHIYMCNIYYSDCTQLTNSPFV